MVTHACPAHATKHRVSVAKAEHVVRFARRRYPRPHRERTWIVFGPGDSDKVDPMKRTDLIAAGLRLAMAAAATA